MRKKFTYAIVLIFIVFVGIGATFFSATPPAGYTGATGGFGTCANAGCHNSFGLNSGGGSVTAPGLPVGTYTANTAYNFSIVITHGTADRTRWGFSIKAVNTSTGASVGTFSDANTNAAPNATELSHLNAPFTGASNTYTFGNLTWTAPATPVPVTFYIVGNASNGDGSALLDYIYSSIQGVALPVTLLSFNAAVKNSSVALSWETATESNSSHFSIQRSYNNQQFSDIGRVEASGSSTTLKSYSFTDNSASYFEKPVYYRLAMVDKDGTMKYSKIISAVLKATSTFIKSVYPNPVKSGSNLHLDFVAIANENITIQLVDNQGRVSKKITQYATKGTNIININLPASAAGIYKLVVKSSGGIMQQPVLVQ